MSIFEILMLVLFGVSWPVNIYKSYKSKNVSGKSIVFNYLVFMGYICGIINKILYNADFVVYLYGLNAVMVIIDTVLYYRYSKKNVIVIESSDD